MDRNLVKRTGATLLVFCIIAAPLLVFADGLVPCGGVISATGKQEPACTYKDFVILINNVIDFLIKDIALPISALLFAWAGFLYLTAAGDEGQVKKAHGVFQNVFFGLILALAGWLIINLIVNVLTGKGLNNFLG